MKAAFLFGCLFLITSSAFGQSRSESLLQTISAEKNYPKRIAAYIAFNDTFGIANFNQWMRLAKEGLGLAQSKSDSLSIAVLQRQVGEAYYFKGQYDTAATFYYHSIGTLERMKAGAPLAKSYNALAKLYRKTRELPRALSNYDKAMQVFSSQKDSAGMAMIWNESGVVFEYNEDYEEAISRYRKSYEIDKQLGDNHGMAYALSNLAGAYTLQKKYAAAESNLLEVLQIRQRLNDSFALSLTYSDMAALFLAARDFAKAKRYVDTSNAIALAMGYAELRHNNLGLLAQAAEGTGDFQAANEFQKQKASLKDSLFNIEKTKEIDKLAAIYETAQKEKRLAEQQFQIQKQNTYLIAGGVGAVLLGLLGFTQYRRYKWKQEARMQEAVRRQQEEAAKAVMEAEDAERQRIAKDLHDGVGQMMSAAKMNLSAFAGSTGFATAEERTSFDKIIELVDESCSEVRSVSHNMMPNALLKNNLDAAMQEFIGRLDNKRLAVHLYTEGLESPLSTNIQSVVYRVVQECVNNVIKHAGATKLDITMICDRDELTATVEDNGKGFDATDSSRFNGIGLKNIRTRVEYLNGSVDFDSAPGRGTLVAIHVPLN